MRVSEKAHFVAFLVCKSGTPRVCQHRSSRLLPAQVTARRSQLPDFRTLDFCAAGPALSLSSPHARPKLMCSREFPAWSFPFQKVRLCASEFPSWL
jgi:hypothetical protein